MISDDGKRFCSTCQFRANAENGVWRYSKDRRTKRWMCGGCVLRRRERLQKIDASSNGEYDLANLR